MSGPVQLGLLVLQADETLEADMRRLLPAHLEFLVSRVPSAPAVTSDTLADMAAVLPQAAGLFPGGARLAAVGYGCTSGTAEIGAARVAELVRAGVQTPAVTDPVTALVTACRALNVTRIGLVSPYVPEVSAQLCTVLAAAGVQVTGFSSFDEPEEAKVARIAPDVIAEAALAMGRNPDCEAVFISCTNLRTLDVIGPVAAQTGKPVLSSNQVLAWDLCRLAGVQAPLWGLA